MIEWIPIIEEGLILGNAIVDEQKKNKLIVAFNYLRKKNKVILLFGPSGSGKTQFIHSLKNSIVTPSVTRTSKTHKIPISTVPTKFIDTPGHVINTTDRRIQIDNLIKKGVEGIINISSYGIGRDIGASQSEVFDSRGGIKSDYLQKNKQNEIDILMEWLPRISPNQNIKWIINLVTKADIWWRDTEKVQNYYDNEYGQKFKELRNFMKIVDLPYCSVLKPFFSRHTSGSFGEQEKAILKNHFIDELLGLLNN